MSLDFIALAGNTHRGVAALRGEDKHRFCALAPLASALTGWNRSWELNPACLHALAGDLSLGGGVGEGVHYLVTILYLQRPVTDCGWCCFPPLPYHLPTSWAGADRWGVNCTLTSHLQKKHSFFLSSISLLCWKLIIVVVCKSFLSYKTYSCSSNISEKMFCCLLLINHLALNAHFVFSFMSSFLLKGSMLNAGGGGMLHSCAFGNLEDTSCMFAQARSKSKWMWFDNNYIIRHILKKSYAAQIKKA